MQANQAMKVTVVYFDDQTLDLKHHIGEFPIQSEGRVVLSPEFKQGKSVIAVCEGENQPLEIEFSK